MTKNKKIKNIFECILSNQIYLVHTYVCIPN